MTMIIGFVKDCKTLENGSFQADETAYLPRKLAQTLVGQGVALTYADFCRRQIKVETEELKVKTEKAVITREVEKAEPPDKQQCEGVKADGERCGATAQPGTKYCWRHKPKEGSS